MESDNISPAALIVGLNPALQRTITLNTRLGVGEVNRAKTLDLGIGGKGQNVATAATILCKDTKNIRLAQFVGEGHEGDTLMRLLVERTRINTSLTTRMSGICRTAITLVDSSGEATEVVEPSSNISHEDLTDLYSKLKSVYTTGNKAPVVAFMGSIPPGCPCNVYAQILRLSADASTRVIIDSASGLSDLLQVAHEMKCFVALKTNSRELCDIGGVKIEKGSEATLATPLAALRDAGNNVFSKFPAVCYIAATDAAFPATVLERQSKSVWRLSMPPLPRAVQSPIGSGDAVAAGTIVSLNSYLEGVESIISKYHGIPDFIRSFAVGLACGSASCMTNNCSVFSLDDYYKILDGIEVSKIDEEPTTETAWTGFGDYMEKMGTPISGKGNNADFEAMLEAALAKDKQERRK